MTQGANDRQVGGSHYRANYQHWDWVLACGLGYLEGCTTKYVCRWRKKEGLKDLQKALHYLNKLEKWGKPPARKLAFEAAIAETVKFVEANDLDALERAYMVTLSTWESREDLTCAREYLFMLMDSAEAVPLTEENHYAERS